LNHSGDPLLDQYFLKKLDGLVLNARAALKGDMGGNRKSRSKGTSIEFSDFREYVVGDDFRRIDWNAYARFERLFVKLFMEEREASITVYVDLSGSMDWGRPNKGRLAKQLAAVFVYIALANLDRVSVMGIRDDVSTYLPYFSGKQGFWKALKFIDELEFGGKTSLSNSIKRYACIKPGGISILITDLFSKDGYQEGLRYLQYQKQEITLVHIMAPWELEPELSGNLRLIDVEDGKAKEIVVTSQVLKAYKKTVDEFLKEVGTFCYTRGINYIPINSAVTVERVVFENLVKFGLVR